MGILPLHVAAFMGHTDILTSLIQNGANLNAPTGGGMTPVYLAALANRTDAVEVLLRKGADVDASTAVGYDWPVYWFLLIAAFETVDRI